ncbi:MAG TPA: hypothetical protein VK446_15690 [Methylocystis sp.]|nr:hypothetical protein [Methylocystis sp.]HXZ15264.1 hypothetical protein [Roseiarcus sp.]
MRGPLLCFLGAALATLVLAAGVNYFVDSGGDFLVESGEGQRLVEGYVEKLRAEPRGLVLPDQDRLIKIELARRSAADCFVIGSSHAFQFDAETAPNIFQGCREVANLAAPAGGFEDLVAIAGFVAERRDGAHFFLEIDPWTLRPNPSIFWAFEYRDVYERARSALGLPPRSVLPTKLLADASALLNFRYLIANLNAVLHGDVKRQKTLAGIAAADNADDDLLMLPSGRFVYGNMEPVALGQVVDGSFNSEEPALDPTTVAEFESVIGALLGRGHRVSFLITPYHPFVVSTCRSPLICRCQKAVEGYVRAASVRWGTRVIGGFDPRPLGLADRDFMDSQHLMLSGVSKLNAFVSTERSARSEAAN